MTSQSPIGSGFNAFSTAAEVIDDVDLRGRTAIITGGYSGLGLEMTRRLAAAGAHVVVPARSFDKAKRALAPLAGVTLETIDLFDPRSIDAFADRFAEREARLDILIHSAGIMAAPLVRDSRGNESQLSVNHLAAFRLTAKLAPALAATGGARVVSMSSRAHRIAAFDFADPNFNERPYDPWKAYGQSKTAVALFALGLDRRGKAHGIRAFSVHPGSILTDLARYLTRDQIAAFGVYDDDGEIRIAPERDLKNIEQGAATSIWCATSPALDGQGGVYCEDCEIAPLRANDDVRPEGVRKWAADPEAAERLWSASEELADVHFPL